MKTTRVVGVLFFVLVFAFSPVFFPNIAVLSQSVPVEEITGYQEWNQSRAIDKDVIVKPGATLVIGKGVELDVTNPATTLRIEGSLFVKGTVKEPVAIKSVSGQGNFSIEAVMNSKVMMRNAEIANGGTQAFQVEKPGKNTVFAASYQGAIQVDGGDVDIQNVTFKNNLYAVIVSSPVATVRVNRSRFIDNGFDVEADGNNADFQYNWWGTSDGPQQSCFTYGNNLQYCYYEKISGNFNFSNWLIQETFRDPVLIVPGILGSQSKNGKLIIDPVYHTYDNLYDEFVGNGYVPEKDIFVFPYEWRDSNIENAKLLQGKIDEVKQSAHWPKVDIVAHSMGGLLAREYVESGYYGNDIDQLITLATPQFGAPEAYIKWDGADWFFSPLDLYMKHIVTQEAKENGFSDIFDYIHNRPIASIQELLPVYDYLYDLDKNGELRKYPNNYPRNEFLENLNSESENLNKVEFDKIIGNLGGDNTIGGMNVVNVNMGKYWVNGYPLGFEIPLGSRGMKLTSGDRSVPLDSAKSENLKSDYLIELSSDHQSIVTDAQKDVLELLTNNRPQKEVRKNLIHRMLFVPVFSPVDVQIVSPSGKKVGKNFATGEEYNEISGAFYTGYDTQNEFITIPNPEEGEYRVLTQGTGAGDYRIEAVSIREDAGGQAEEKVATFSGTAEMGKESENRVEIDETGGVVVADDRDVIAPTTTAALSGSMGTSDWYLGDATVTLTAQDNEGGSGVEKTEYSLDNGTNWQTYAAPFVISQEGTIAIQYFSTDNEGNKEAIKTETVKIDKTAPEGKIVFNPTTQKLAIIGIDNLSQNVSVVTIAKPEMNVSGKKVKKIKPWFSRWFQKNRKNLPDMLATITDEAGHTTSIAFEKTKDRNGYLFIGVKSLAYDESEPLSLNGAVQYKWRIDKKHLYRLFAAHLRTSLTDIESHYIPKKNETWIMEKPKDLADDDRDDESERRPVRKRLSGMVIPYLQTGKGSIT